MGGIKAENSKSTILLTEVLSFLEKSKRQHHYSDDCWYTCPKHPEGCCNIEEPDRCNCGAEQHNEQADELINKIKNTLFS